MPINLETLAFSARFGAAAFVSTGARASASSAPRRSSCTVLGWKCARLLHANALLTAPAAGGLKLVPKRAREVRARAHRRDERREEHGRRVRRARQPVRAGRVRPAQRDEDVEANARLDKRLEHGVFASRSAYTQRSCSGLSAMVIGIGEPVRASSSSIAARYHSCWECGEAEARILTLPDS